MENIDCQTQQIAEGRLNPLQRSLLWLGRCYQLLLSPLLGPRCRFYPSCSNFFLEAVTQHGAMRGTLLSIRRLLKCHPWHPGGLDPVPGKSRGCQHTRQAPAHLTQSRLAK